MTGSPNWDWDDIHARCGPAFEIGKTDALATPVDRLVTVVETDDGEDLVAVPGYHLVNAVTYARLMKPLPVAWQAAEQFDDWGWMDGDTNRQD